MRYLLLDTTSIDEATNTVSSPNLRRVKDLSAQIVVTAASTPSSASATLQKSNDGTNWVDVASATSISANGTIMIEDSDVGYSFARVAFAISSGSFSARVLLSGQEVDV